MHMKCLFLAVLIAALSSTSSFYDFQFTTIEGVNRFTNEFQGKKVVIVVLPASPQLADVPYLLRLDSLSSAHPEIVMMGVPSYEYGFVGGNLTDLTNWYRAVLGSQFIITTGLHTDKSAGSNQHPLFKWLTDKNENSHFDDDVAGPGQQFVINEQGNLCGVARPEGKMSNRLFTLMRTATPVTE